MLDSHLTTYIPQAVNNILYFLHYFISERLWIFEVLNSKRKKVTKTPERSGLEPKTSTIRSRIFGLSTWAICELTIAGGKRSTKTFRTGQPRTTCTSIAALATQRHDAFVSHFSSRRKSQWWANYRKTPLISTYVFSGLATEQVLIFGAVLTFGGYDKAEAKILQGRSLFNPVLSAHNTLLCMFQRLCTYFQIQGYLYSGGMYFRGIATDSKFQ